MSGVGSAGSAAGAAVPLSALIDAELQALAAEGAALRALLAEGDVLQAQVLPPNGLTDLLAIAGYRVAASLPPNLTPGEVVTVLVTGVENGQISVQIVPSDTPLTNSLAPTSAGAGPQPAAAPAPAPGAPVAPSPAVFAAAAVRSAGAAGAAIPSIIVSPEPIAPAALARTPSPIVPGQPVAVEDGETLAARAPRAPLQAPAAPLSGSIEARIAASRATVVSRGNAPPAPAPVAATPGAPVRPFVAPPFVVRSAVFPAEPDRAPAAPGAKTPSPAAPAAPGIPAALAAPAGPRVPAVPEVPAVRVARGLAAFKEPVALLHALRLPVTPTNVAAAKLALEQPQRLPAALSALERALPSATGDPRVATLRTISAFISRLDPRSPTLATQLASYVEHALEGSEPKLTALLAALQDAEAAQTPPSTAPAPAAVEGKPHPASVPTAQLAQSTERATALQYDLKQQLLSVAQTPPPNAATALTDAVAETLTAITALQMQTLAHQTPQTIALSLPIALPNGTATASITIDREAPERGGTGLDGDNFHIAFILETAHLGVVAIDLVTVGRSVTLELKTEAALAAQYFARTLDRLSERFRTLRYTVVKAQSSVAAPGMARVVSTATPGAPATPADPNALVDHSA